ncbi:Uncharacterised protein [Mycobacterium tuberculosis]|nr:Uncharacterised protein [Mycobacterium tuberculosis]COW17842.1 Uncharacterised protein [Mycobacterium tuberculosis]
MNQRSDPGDQQHEAHGQLIDLQPEVDLESAGGYPGEHLLMDRALEPIATEHVGQQHRAHPECRQRCGTAQQVAPRIGASAAEQQDCGTRQWQCHQQPGVVSPQGSCHGGVVSL